VKIVVAGGTGFLGVPLTASFAADGHEVVVLTRRPARAGASRTRHVTWSPADGAGAWRAEVDAADAIVNLAGEPIAARRWSHAQKQRILDSRVQATRSLVSAIGAAPPRSRVFVSGSGVGYYGPRGDEAIDEKTPAGSDFLARVCTAWEDEAGRAAGAATRVVCVRTGLVLEKDGGALPRMLPPFRIGAGGPVGSGRQYWPWIHRADWVALIRWIVETDRASGPINATAPEPVRNAAFARALGRTLRRPALLPAPAFMLRLALGEMADALLLSGQQAMPAKAIDLGYAFRYGRLEPALAAIFGRP
jgi:uncharacterized protein (TIGR01777 family)